MGTVYFWGNTSFSVAQGLDVLQLYVSTFRSLRPSLPLKIKRFVLFFIAALSPSKIERFFFMLLVPLIVGCALNPPRVEMTHAELTLQAAIEAGAERWAPDLVQKAKDHFRLAERAMKERLYSDARQQAKEALRFAEEAEEKAILQGAP